MQAAFDSGATFGAMTAGGDPRRLADEPGVPWIVRVHGPYSYRSPIYRGRSDDEGDQVIIDLMEQTIQYEGPENVAAILLEGYKGGEEHRQVANCWTTLG